MKTTKIKPLFKNIVVRQQEIQEKTSSGIYVPQDAAEGKQKAQGIVVAIGPEVTAIGVGEMVLFTKWGGEIIDIDGVEHKVINQEDILAIIYEK